MLHVLMYVILLVFSGLIQEANCSKGEFCQFFSVDKLSFLEVIAQK